MLFVKMVSGNLGKLGDLCNLLEFVEVVGREILVSLFLGFRSILIGGLGPTVNLVRFRG